MATRHPVVSHRSEQETYIADAGFEVLTTLSMKSTILRSTGISEEGTFPPSLWSKRRQESLIFNPEDGDDMCLRSISEHLQNYMVLQSRILHSSSNKYLSG
jgi:hypothetical protein